MGGDSEAIPGHLQSNISSSDLYSGSPHSQTPTPSSNDVTNHSIGATPTNGNGNSNEKGNGDGNGKGKGNENGYRNGKNAVRSSENTVPAESRYQLSLGRSNPSDADDVLSIALPVFTQTFAHTCSSDDMTLYLNTHFTPEHILAELNNPNKRFLIAYDTTDTLSSSSRGRCAGFAQLTIGSSEPCVEDISDKVELQRIYVDSEHHGSGLARLLMDAALSVAKSEGYKNIWLGVLQGNTRAEKFYQKFGFERVGQHDFYLGSDKQTDDILVKSL